MAPKTSAPSKKTEQKAKSKIIEDKTFGLKNKNKSAKVANFVKSVEKTVNEAGNKKQRKEEEELRAAKQKKKDDEEARKIELNQIFKPVVPVQKAAFGVDPKSLLCQYFKLGMCTKGEKCKFSHDPTVERKAAKIDLYTDNRDKEKDTMDLWDQVKLEQVVQQKNKNNSTDIVCKFFLDALESKKYGWFWECPNGETCKYRHALPDGYVMKEKKKDEEVGEVISLEEFLETERHKLGDNLTPVTFESFQKWKTTRNERLKAEEKAKQKSKEADYKSGKIAVSGRDLFVYQPDIFKDDEEAADIDYNAREDEVQTDEIANQINELDISDDLPNQ